MAKKMESIKELMEETKITPLVNNNDTPIVSFEQQRDLAQEMAHYGMSNKFAALETDFNPDGTLARTKYANAAVNFNHYFDNRYRVIETEDGNVMQVVTAQTTDGFRAISEQATGRVFQKQVPVYEFKRVDGKLQFAKLSVVSDVEFIAEFTHKLGAENLKEVLLLIPVDVNVAEEKMPI